MNKRKTSLEKLTTGARFEGIKPNIPVYKPTGTKKLVRRLHEDDVELQKFIGAIIGAIASAAASVAAALPSAASAAGGALAAVGRSAVGRGALDAASEAEAPEGVEAPELAPPTSPQEAPEDEMEEEAQQAPTKVDQAIAEIQALGKSTEYPSNRQAPEYPPTHGGLLGPKRIDWKKKEHGEPTSSIKKEGDGGGEGVSGTVFTSTNAGIFTPTYGGGGSPYKEDPKKKKKSTGIERLGRFLTDGSPVKLKDVEKSSVFNLTELLNEVRLDLRKEKKQVPYGSKPIEDDPPQVVERNNPSPEAKEPKKRTVMPKSDEEIKRDKVIDESKQSHHGIEQPYGLQLQQWGSGHTEVDALKRGGDHDILTPPPESDEEEKETTIPKDPDLKVVGTEGYEKYIKYLQQMKEEGDEFPLMNAFWKVIDDEK